SCPPASATIRGRDRGRGHRRPGGCARAPAAQGRRWARMNQMNDPASRAKRARTAELGLLYAIALIVLVIDQLTKVLAVALLEGRPPVPGLGALAGFTADRHPGAALGRGAGVTGQSPLIAIGVFVAILALSRKPAARAWAIGLGLLLGGLVGKPADRLFRATSFLHGA